MPSKIRRRLPSPAIVLALFALVAALAGTAVALPGKNSVDSGDLKANSVTVKKIKKNAVTAKKIKDNSVTTSKVADASITAPKLAPGAVSAGSLGDGSVTATKLGTINIRTAESPLTTDADGTQNGPAGSVATATATAKCQAGETLISGGAKWTQGNNDNNENLYINESYPSGGSWVAEGIVDFGAQGQAKIQAIAICLA